MTKLHAPPSSGFGQARLSFGVFLATAALLLTIAPPSAGAEGSAASPDDVITIVGGERADIDDFPFMVGLYQLIDGVEMFACTGTIVEADWVLTAAHCVDVPAEDLTVYSGVTDQRKRLPEQASPVAEKIVHPAYRLDEEGLFFDHDIALLRLSTPLADPQVIDLWSDQSGPAVGADATAIGWGVSDKRPAGGLLQQVDVPVLAEPDAPTCTRYPRWLFHSGSMVCAADLELGRSACYGDSGGPLVLEDPETGGWIQVGVTSFGAGCGSDSYGVGYVRVSTYLPWINLMIGSVDGCTLVGTEGDDQLVGTSGDDVICGLGGDDVLRGGGGNDILLGHDGDDQLWGGSGADKLFGASGNDRLHAGPGNDFLEGSSGNDFLSGGRGADSILGGYASDRLFGGKGRDFLAGGTGNDWLFGGDGRDLLFGGFDLDRSRGGKGPDVCQESEVSKSCRVVN